MRVILREEEEENSFVLVMGDCMLVVLAIHCSMRF